MSLAQAENGVVVKKVRQAAGCMHTGSTAHMHQHRAFVSRTLLAAMGAPCAGCAAYAVIVLRSLVKLCAHGASLRWRNKGRMRGWCPRWSAVSWSST